MTREEQYDLLNYIFMGDFITNLHVQALSGNPDNILPKGTTRYTISQRKLNNLKASGYVQELEVDGFRTNCPTQKRYYVRTKAGSEFDGLPYKPHVNKDRRPQLWEHDHLLNDWIFHFYRRFAQEHGLTFDNLPKFKFKLPDGSTTKVADSALIIDDYVFIIEVERSRSESGIIREKLIPYSQVEDWTPYQSYIIPGEKDYQPLREPFSKKVKILIITAHHNSDIFRRPWEFQTDEKAQREAEMNRELMMKVVRNFPGGKRFLFTTAENFADCDKAIWTRDGKNWESLMPKLK